MSLALSRRGVAAIRQRVRAWAFERERAPQPVMTLDRRRIYIVPTRAGFGFGLISFALLMGAMNYSNSMAFCLCFLMVGLGLVAMQHTHRNLAELRIEPGRHLPVFAGQPAQFQFLLSNPGQIARHALRIRFLDEPATHWHDVASAAQTAVEIALPAPRRGWLRAPRLVISTRFPFGLFRAWTYARLDTACLIYPQPADSRLVPPPSRGEGKAGLSTQDGMDDFAGLREYQPGDAPRHIHWRLYAHHDHLLVKRFADPRTEPLWLDWETLTGLDIEARLSQLARWVLDAHRTGRDFGLRLPGVEITPAGNELHRRQCLQALATFQNPA